MTPKLTNGGENLILRAMDGETITFTGIALGNGNCPENFKASTALENQQVLLELDTYSLEDEGYIKLKATLQNSEIEASFRWTEVGIFAEDPDGGSDDILYAYGHYLLEEDEGQNAPALVPKIGSSVVEMEIEYDIFVGDAENVAAAIAGASVYATRVEFQQHTGARTNPHGVTKTQVGLGNVPNVSTNDQTPTWTVSGMLVGLVSGEKLTAAFGKIAKAVSELITHIQDTARHVTTEEKTLWNGKVDANHNHSAASITTGTLNVSRGGTGASDAMGAAVALKVLPLWGRDAGRLIQQNDDLNDYKTGGRYYCRSDVASTLDNSPVQTMFWLVVFGETQGNFWQFLFSSDDAKIYYRRCLEYADGEEILLPQEVGSEYSAWKLVNTTSV